MPKTLAICSIEDCQTTVKALNLCAKHWKRLKNTGTTDKTKNQGGQTKLRRPCEVEGCERVLVAKGYCSTHYRRVWLYDDPNHLEYTGDKKPSKYKVVVAPDGHLNANKNGQITEHRLVMTEMIGRPLAKGENVHHKNGDTLDNRPENLELWNTSQPAGQRPSDKVEYAIMILKLYAPELLKGDEA